MPTYANLAKQIANMTPEQQEQDVTIAVVSDGIEVFSISNIVNPLTTDDNEYESLYVDEIDGTILDSGHPYLITYTD
jgi:hypothetical protein